MHPKSIGKLALEQAALWLRFPARILIPEVADRLANHHRQSSVRKELEVWFAPEPIVAIPIVSNLCSYNVTPEELFDLFGKFGPIRYGSHAKSPYIMIFVLTVTAARSARESRIRPRERLSWSTRM